MTAIARITYAQPWTGFWPHVGVLLAKAFPSILPLPTGFAGDSFSFVGDIVLGPLPSLAKALFGSWTCDDDTLGVVTFL